MRGSAGERTKRIRFGIIRSPLDRPIFAFQLFVTEILLAGFGVAKKLNAA